MTLTYDELGSLCRKADAAMHDAYDDIVYSLGPSTLNMSDEEYSAWWPVFDMYTNQASVWLNIAAEAITSHCHALWEEWS